MTDEPIQKKRYTAPAEIKTNDAKTEEPQSPVVGFLRLDFHADGTYTVDTDEPLSLRHAGALSELARDICNHFHAAALKAQLSKGQVGLPRTDPRLREMLN